ncbi:hypothetical protein BGZ95_008141, partial [Linnemannia exigua]
MVERKTNQPLQDPVNTGYVKNQTATTAESSTTQVDPCPNIKPDPDRQQPSYSLASQMFRCSILAAGMALVWAAALSLILPLSHSSYGHSTSSFHSDRPIEFPDFAYLVFKQAAMFETFADALARLDAPINLDLNNDCSNRHGTGCQYAYRDPSDTHGLVAAGSTGLPLHMTMKMAELAIIDLKVAVKYSRFSEVNKALMVEHMESFHSATEAHTRKLMLLGARSKACLDRQVVQNVFLSTELDRLGV